VVNGLQVLEQPLNVLLAQSICCGAERSHPEPRLPVPADEAQQFLHGAGTEAVFSLGESQPTGEPLILVSDDGRQKAARVTHACRMHA
jgi:hypothetical protein